MANREVCWFLPATPFAGQSLTVRNAQIAIMSRLPKFPVVDIFAGPGGLGEGFSAYRTGKDHSPFEVRLSIEKDAYAHETLRLRSFYRQFPSDEVPEVYYDVLRRSISLKDLPERLKDHPNLLAKWRVAERDALHAELGSKEFSHESIGHRIRAVLGSKQQHWILIGGPPCQAYSVVGRARNRGIADYRIEQDHRSSLYREYLRIIADHWPSVFVMENVKGLLSAKLNDECVFDRIVSDLGSPLAAFGSKAATKPRHRYRVVPLIRPADKLLSGVYDPNDFVVPSERFGIPQVRHRVILIGIREDLGDVDPAGLVPSGPVSVKDAIGDLPPLRSGLSRSQKGGKYVSLEDSADLWLRTLLDQTALADSKCDKRWLKAMECEDVRDEILNVVRSICAPRHDRGSEFIRCSLGKGMPKELRSWYLDERLEGICNHQSRAHLDADLTRYLFAACFAKVNLTSPKLPQFPADLQPDHENAATGDFDDRFRVQLADRPSTTITSHISKDGHYFIHPDPSQCRSLTVREAARLQTFPDNYFFCGPRTAQYVQVGNAVPPLLAYKIAESIWDFLIEIGAVG
jgi:DNA (cytosine-5)-methyltransferase 1